MELSEKLKINKELRTRPDLVEYMKDLSWSVTLASFKHHNQGEDVSKKDIFGAIDDIVATDEF